MNLLSRLMLVLAAGVAEYRRTQDQSGHELEERVKQRTDELARSNQMLREEFAERSRVEHALQQAQQRFRDIFDSSHDGMAYVTLDGLFLEVNDAFVTLTGYSRDELNAMTYQDLTPPEYHDVEAGRMQALLKAGHTAQYEKEYVRKDGSRVPIEITVFVVRDSAGTPTGLAGFVRDITQRRQAEAALSQKEQLIWQAQEDRERLSRDLHDDIIQTIYAIGMGLEATRTLIEPSEARRELSEAIEGLNRVIRSVRSCIVNM